MSYILEALKKAEAEREQGKVPDLHSHAGPVPWLSQQRDRARPAALWVLTGLVLILGAALLWFVLTRPDAGEASNSASNSASTTLDGSRATVAQMKSAAPTVAAQPPNMQPVQPRLATDSKTSMASPPTPSPPRGEVGADLASAQGPAPQAAPPSDAVERKAVEKKMAERTAGAPRTAAPQAPRALAASVTSPSAAQTAGAQASANPVPSEARDPSAGTLPEALRRELPQLNFGGAMYSDNPANRLLFINGQVYHEGDEVQAGLKLERIQLKAAVFNYKGYRYTASY